MISDNAFPIGHYELLTVNIVCCKLLTLELMKQIIFSSLDTNFYYLNISSLFYSLHLKVVGRKCFTGVCL